MGVKLDVQAGKLAAMSAQPSIQLAPRGRLSTRCPGSERQNRHQEKKCATHEFQALRDSRWTWLTEAYRVSMLENLAGSRQDHWYPDLFLPSHGFGMFGLSDPAAA